MRDVLPVLEVAYQLERDRGESLAAIAATAADAIDTRSMLLAFETPPSDDMADFDARTPAVVRPSEPVVALLASLDRLGPAPGARALLRAPSRFWLGSEQFRGTAYLATARALGVPDCGVIHARSGPGQGLNLTTFAPDLARWAPERRAHWTAVAGHLGAAWRLRRRLAASTVGAAVGAELAVDGRVRGSPGPLSTSARAALREAVLQREAARDRRRGSDSEHLWPALVAGRWTLVDAFTAGGARHVVAHENADGGEALRALPPAERMVVELVLAGRAGKWIALDLGLSEAAVSRQLRRALRRLGAADLASLAGVRAALFEPLADLPGVAAARLDLVVDALARLTPAQRAIVRLLADGRSIAAIARARGTSPRTVAHQVTALYAALGVGSRRELLARLG